MTGIHSLLPYLVNTLAILVAHCCAGDGPERIYLIALGHEYGPFEYIGDNGYLVGFHHELIDEVCAAAGVNCMTVWEPYQNCIKSLAGQPSRAGIGLMDGWYDACMGWTPTVDRLAYVKFSESWRKVWRTTFIVRASDTSFDADNFKDKKIGFVDGFADDEMCLTRNTGVVLPVENIKLYQSEVGLKNDLEKGKIDAAYVYEGAWGKDPRFKHVGPWYKCRVRGQAIMSRKDSEFPAIWNEGFGKLVSSGRFKKLCKEAEEKHKAEERGYEMLCV